MSDDLANLVIVLLMPTDSRNLRSSNGGISGDVLDGVLVFRFGIRYELCHVARVREEATVSSPWPLTDRDA